MLIYRLVTIAAVLAAACFGQGNSGTIEGRITDPSGAIIPSAAVTITNVATNVVRQTRSNTDGMYVVPFLPSGTYSIVVEQKGFSVVKRSGISLRVDDKLTVNVALEVGGATSRVEVTGSAPLVNEVSGSLGMVIDDRRISDLPLDGREPFSLAGLSPGVIPVPPTANVHQGGALPGINGTSNGTSAAVIDGVPDSTNVVGGQNMQLVYTPSVDTVAEFKVETNALSAEYGRYNGGVISLITKSGTNQPHGTAYDFLRNSFFDANNFFNNRSGIPLASLKRNQFGATLGGPVYLPKLYRGQNRTFFFVDYEGFRQSVGSNASFTVPTPAQRTGDFSQTFTSGRQLVTIYDPLNLQTVNGVQNRAAFPGNIIPQNRLNPVALNLQKYFPQPNNVALTGNFAVSASLKNTDDTGGVRIDHNFSDRHHISGRFSIQYPGTGAANYYGNIGNYGNPPLVQRRYHDSVQDTISLSPTLILNINYGVLHQYGARIAWSDGFDITSLGFAPNFAAGQQVKAIPLVTISGYSGLGNTSQNSGTQFSQSLAGSVTKITGGHTVKAGSEVRFYREAGTPNVALEGSLTFANTFVQGPSPFQASANSGNAYAAFLLGIPGGTILNQPVPLSSANWYSAFYVQDDWKVTPKLSLNIGLRYDINFPRTESQNRTSIFDPNAPSPLAALSPQFSLLKGAMMFADDQNRAYAPTELHDVAPRFGLAYRIDSSTVMRAGYGIFYGLSPTAAVLTQGGYLDGFSATTSIVTSLDGVTPIVSLSNPFPNGITPTATRSQLSTGTLLGQAVNSVNIGQATPYVQNWNFSLQRSLGSSLLLQVAYAGSKGTRLPLAATLDVNSLTTAQYQLGAVNNQLVPNPFFGYINDPTSILSKSTVTRGQLLKPFPQYTALNAILPTMGNSSYHSFQASLEKRFSKGFTVQGAFTAGKLIDDSSQAAAGAKAAVQDPTNLRAERTIDPQDVSQRLVVSGVWELPFGRNRLLGSSISKWMDAVAGGWQMNGIVTAQTGQPLLMTSIGVARPDVVGTPKSLGGPVQDRLNHYFDTSAYAVPAAFTYGNSTPTAPNLRAPGVANCDLSLFKNFQPRERLRAQLRLEAFNALNRVQFSAPGAQAGTTGFGVIGSQANLPRELQVAMKLIF